MIIDFKKLLFFILITIIPSFIVGSFTDSSGFDTLIKPELTPPGFIFPIVWSILYILMGISSYLIYVSPNGTDSQKKIALSIYFIQLILNFMWTPIFFNLELYLLAFIWIILLIILVLFMIFSFYKIDKKAAYLQIPYLIWLVFAGYLSYMIYILN